MIIANFSKEEFKNLSFPIHKTDNKKDLIEQIPELKEIKMFEVLPKVNRDAMIQYILLMYDKNSPLIRKYAELSTRKREAGFMAGFDQANDSHSRLLSDMSDFKDPLFCEAVVEFLQFQNNLILAMLVSNEQTFFEYQSVLLSATAMINNDKDKISATILKSKLMDDSDTIADRIGKYYKQLYIEDKVVEYVKKKSYSPESVAIQ